MSRCLFITWDGPQASYVEGLFLPIFAGLAKHGHQFHVLQFTWADPARVQATERACRAIGVPYRTVRISRSLVPFGPLLTALMGAGHIGRAVRDWRIDTLMPRSIMPALATLAMPRRDGLRIVFDADGLAVDERVDFQGLSPRSLQYRALRHIEARMVRLADTVLTRTEASIRVLSARAGDGTDLSKFHVVTNGRQIPAPPAGRAEGETTGPVICYLGTIGDQHCPQTMLAVARSLRARLPDATFRVFSADGARLERVIAASGMRDRGWITIARLAPGDVSAHLARCDLALAFRKQAFSTQGVSPIKLGDYLLAGLPIIGSAGVGETGPLIDAGVFLDSDGTDTDRIVDWVCTRVMPDRAAIRATCRGLGEAHFSVTDSIARYARALG